MNTDRIESSTAFKNRQQNTDTLTAVRVRKRRVGRSNKMLTKLEISNYRGFKSYGVTGLARVNLLVGRNNSGKTAILEGLHLLTSRGDPAALVGAASRRGEIVMGQSRTDRIERLTDVAPFFHGHELSLNT